MIFGPWITVLLMLLGCAVALLEGSICLALLTPLFLVCGTAGGLAMGLALIIWEFAIRKLKAVAALPFLLAAGRSSWCLCEMPSSRYDTLST